MRKSDRRRGTPRRSGPRQPRNLIQVWLIALAGAIVPLGGLAFGESAVEGIGLAVLAVGVTGTIETVRLQRRRDRATAAEWAGSPNNGMQPWPARADADGQPN
jgi:hypothetical protein